MSLDDLHDLSTDQNPNSDQVLQSSFVSWWVACC